MIPRSLSSGALSIFSKSTAAFPATRAERVFVIAAVKVVFTVVYVSDSTNVAMRFASLKLFSLAIFKMSSLFRPVGGNYNNDL